MALYRARYSLASPSLGNDEGWLNPRYTDPVNGTTIVWMRKPMSPDASSPDIPRDAPVREGRNPPKAFQIHKDYPNILVMPEQFQMDEHDFTGDRLRDPEDKQVFLDHVVALFKQIGAGRTGRELLKTLNDMQKITLLPDGSPDSNYDPEKTGNFTIVDQGNKELGTRGNVLILGPSEDRMESGSFADTFRRTVSAAYPSSALGTGSMVAYDPTVSFELSQGKILDPYVALGHELCHCWQNGLGLQTEEHVTEVPHVGPDAGQSVTVPKAESDVVSEECWDKNNSGYFIGTKEYIEIADKSLIRIEDAVKSSQLDAAGKKRYEDSLQLRRDQCEGKTPIGEMIKAPTEEMIEQDSRCARGLEARGSSRKTYGDATGKFFRTDDPVNPDSWVDIKRRAGSCSGS